METSSVKRVSASPQAQCEFDDATSTRDQGSISALFAMIASNVVLLVMLAA